MQRATYDKLFSVAGKSVLITGGSQGIGFMLAGGFLAAGARVYITGRKADALEAARAQLAPLGDVQAVVSDVGTPEGIEAIDRAIRQRDGKLHVLVNNAGITWGAPFESFPEKAWNKVMTVNVQGPFVLLQRMMPYLTAVATADDPARVINIGSVYATVTHVMQAYSYAASKAAIQQITRILARELAPQHVLVNAIAPGLFHTKMTHFAMNDADSREEILDGIPLHRGGTAEDITGLAVMLSSRAGSYITGSIIHLDGGLMVNH
jgi:NAD(P)-dependent dehydrogenase (short-subunit alcohol dehydrogenase family)